MKKDRKSVDERQRKILQMIRDRGEVKVEEVASVFGISFMTVRRDLQYLEEQHLVSRFYGGASAVKQQRTLTQEEEVSMYRDLISQYAAQFVEDGDSLFINGSRTALKMLEYVTNQRVTVYTNNAWAVGTHYPSGVSLHLTGGELRDNVMVGDYVMRNLLSITADKTFVGCAAVYDNGEFRYDIPTEIGINEAMISRTAKDLYILADHTKIKNRAAHENLYGSCTYERPWTLITDEQADPISIERLRQTGMKVIQVSAHQDDE
jgi:DeoR/GlpR family transcriptional regulator of sugar metabolism